MATTEMISVPVRMTDLKVGNFEVQKVEDIDAAELVFRCSTSSTSSTSTASTAHGG